MTNKQLFDLHSKLCKKALKLMEKKNHDYATGMFDTGEKIDPFVNFRMATLLRICTPEQGILLRMSDKLSRLSTFCKSGIMNVESESVEDTLIDIINYAILMRGLLEADNVLKFDPLDEE